MERFEFIMEGERQSSKKHRLLKDLYDPVDVLDDAQCIELYRFDRRELLQRTSAQRNEVSA